MGIFSTIRNLNYPALVKEKKFLDDNSNLDNEILDILKRNNYKQIICNGKIFEIISGLNNYVKRNEIVNIPVDNITQCFFIHGDLNDIEIVVNCFQRWDDDRTYFIDKGENIFVLNIINWIDKN